jgi:hypothetical protein
VPPLGGEFRKAADTARHRGRHPSLSGATLTAWRVSPNRWPISPSVHPWRRSSAISAFHREIFGDRFRPFYLPPMWSLPLLLAEGLPPGAAPAAIPATGEVIKDGAGRDAQQVVDT